MAKPARQWLEELEAWVSDPDTPLCEIDTLWSILTALRGPDNYSHTLKAKTTCVLRGVVLPKFATSAGALTSYGTAGALSPVAADEILAHCQKEHASNDPSFSGCGHFRHHVIHAVVGLANAGYINGVPSRRVDGRAWTYGSIRDAVTLAAQKRRAEVEASLPNFSDHSAGPADAGGTVILVDNGDAAAADPNATPF